MLVVVDALVDGLLALPTAGSRRVELASSGLLDAAGLAELLATAEASLQSDPRRAREIAALCAESAVAAGAPELRPRADYLLAQAHAIDGEFAQALELVRSAHDAYGALGQELAALRTDMGRMDCLNGLGRHGEAVAVGEAAFAALARMEIAGDTAGGAAGAAQATERVVLRAPVAVFFTTGANDIFIAPGSAGALRVGWASAGIDRALDWPCGEQAASRTRAGNKARWARMGVERLLGSGPDIA